ncbi:hypothetical protein [Croceicoccus gelatinilyticus]|uniref:hypothetical protein n=1 Tax=Croceicoccus gelatinilyticus TaxID=2835536 RepID=UPI001BCACB12|nr:hypothetical protein [Croceicoccus gelatinilyticus]MBS7671602.1 hypothetical protein [Croceicoccus gelatinilyticus]
MDKSLQSIGLRGAFSARQRPADFQERVGDKRDRDEADRKNERTHVAVGQPNNQTGKDGEHDDASRQCRIDRCLVRKKSHLLLSKSGFQDEKAFGENRGDDRDCQLLYR